MNTVGIIARTTDFFQSIIEDLGDENKQYVRVKYLSKDLNQVKNEDILEKIEALHQEKVDFIAMEALEWFEDFEALQYQSPILILNPMDTLVYALGKDLNQFPLWILSSSLGRRLLDLHGFSYQLATKETKEALSLLKDKALTKEEREAIIHKETLKYKSYGVDSIVFDQHYVFADLKQVNEIDLYHIMDAYRAEIINLLKK